MRDVFRPTVRAVPPELRRELDIAQVYHEVLEHRWYLSEQAGRDVGLEAAVADYVANVLPRNMAATAVQQVDVEQDG